MRRPLTFILFVFWFLNWRLFGIVVGSKAFALKALIGKSFIVWSILKTMWSKLLPLFANQINKQLFDMRNNEEWQWHRSVLYFYA